MYKSKDPIFIGGASRSGTSLMARLLKKACKRISVLPVEGWLDLYMRNYPLINERTGKIFLGNYLNHGRSTNTKRTEFEAPLDSCNATIEDFRKVIPSQKMQTLEFLNWILSYYAKSNNAETWGVKDTYCELYFEKVSKLLPRLKLIIMIRDPRASLCSELYFGTYPKRNNAKTSALTYRLLAWCMSVDKARQLAEKLQQSVIIVKYEELISEPDIIHGNLASFLKDDLSPFLKGIFPKPFSSYGVKNGGFYNTTDKWKTLLCKDEVKLIEYVARPYMDFFGYESLYSKYNFSKKAEILKVFSKALNSLSYHLPNRAFELLDYLWFPERIAYRIYWLGKFFSVYFGICKPSILSIKNNR